MVRLFRKRLEIKTVATGIVEDFLDTEVRSILKLLETHGSKHDVMERVEETFAFVFIIAVVGIDMSHLGDAEKEKLLSVITTLWLERFVQPVERAFRLLTDRTASYLHQYGRFARTRESAERIKMIQMYMERLGINDSRAFLASVNISTSGKILALCDFINDLSVRHKFA
jgi:hypothetical protein